MGCQLIGRWRIVEADIWDRDYLDLVEPAMMVVQANGHGEIVFGAMQAGLDLEYSRTLVFFTWEGFDEMDEVRDSGPAPPNSRTTVPSRSSSPTTMATKQPSRPNAPLLQQPVRSKTFTWAADPDKIIAAVNRGYQLLDSIHCLRHICADDQVIALVHQSTRMQRSPTYARKPGHDHPSDTLPTRCNDVHGTSSSRRRCVAKVENSS